jgi:two-component system sensor histidine kinase BaeS
MTVSTIDWPVWNLEVVDRADRRVIGVALGTGIAVDLGVRSEIVSLGGAVAAFAAALALVASGRLHTTASRACAAAATLVGAFLAVRTSEWLVAIDVLSITALLVLAGVLARDGRLSDVPARLLAARCVVAVGHGFASAAFLLAPLRPLVARRPSSAVLRGLALAAPVVLVLGALLASADAVFASVLRVDVSVPEDLAGHVVLIVIGALAIGGILRTASADSTGTVPPVERRLGSVEWTIVLGSMIVLFAGFALAQLVTLTGGADHVLRTEGLTYAEYARAGYFQLLAVAVLTGAVLAVLGAVARRTPRFTVLVELVLALTAVILVVAIRKLGLYEEAYGWTMLRLFSKAFAIWLGLALVLTAVRIAGVGQDRDWLVPAALGAGLAIVVGLNVMNPEAAVARHNLTMDREIDPAYLAGLSDDAVPVLAEHPELHRVVCADRDRERGLLEWNLAASRADAACD